MGDKYIIELEEKPFHKDNGDFLYRVKGFNSLVFDMNGLDKLTPYPEPDLDAIRKEVYYKGYETAKHECEQCRKVRADAEQELAEKAYQRGLNDAWEVSRKITKMNDKEASAIFDTWLFQKIFEANSASEAIEKIRQYEQKEEQIQVGDEIVCSNGQKYVVFIVYDEKKLVTAFRHDGYKKTIESKWVTKTGRHFPEIAEVLRKMKENSDG